MENQSIHPRVVGGRTYWDKVNTSLPPNKDRAIRVATALKKHLEAHPNDAMSRARLAKLGSTPGAVR